jgi:hypothetical protein
MAISRSICYTVMMPKRHKNTSLRIETIDADALAKDRAWWEIYDASFPYAERESRDIILSSAKHDVLVVLRAVHGHKTVGIAVAHILHDVPAIFLLYIAVVLTMQGKHLGTTLFKKVMREGIVHLQREHLHAKGMVWEVEIPELAPTPDEKILRARRIAFYTKLGASVLPIPYLLPPLHKTKGKATPLFLMYLPRKKPLARHAQKKLVKDIYSGKYQQADGIPQRLLKKLLSII